MNVMLTQMSNAGSTNLSEKISAAWARINPVEPSPAYLAKVMAAFVTIMLVALLIGYLS